MNKKLKAKFIGPKVEDTWSRRHDDLTIDKIYYGQLDITGQFSIYSDDAGDSSFMDTGEFIIVSNHDNTTHIHKCVYNRKHYILIGA